MLAPALRLHDRPHTIPLLAHLAAIYPEASHLYSMNYARTTNCSTGSDIESEDEDEEEDEEEESTSEATTGAGGRVLTARQAVLANVVDSSHVSLCTIRSCFSLACS